MMKYFVLLDSVGNQEGQLFQAESASFRRLQSFSDLCREVQTQKVHKLIMLQTLLPYEKESKSWPNSFSC